MDISTYSAYDMRVFGFVGERLLDVWLTKNGIVHIEQPVVNMERQYWIKKGLSFLQRKFKAYENVNYYT